MKFEKNQIYQVTIQDIGAEGEGIGKIDGFPLFIKDAIVGDIVRAKIMKAKKNYAFARLEEIIEPSPSRIDPPCFCYRQCGGCQIQALSYEEQLLFKQNKVKNNLIRIAGISEEQVQHIMEPIVSMETPWHYRNKAQYPFGYGKDGEVVTGFYAGRTHAIIPNTNCLLGAEENEDVLKAVLGYIEQTRATVYDEKTGKGLIRHVLIRKSHQNNSLMVCVIINGKKLPKQDVLIEKLTKIEKMASISLNRNQSNTNVIMGNETETIWGESTIEDALRLWEKSEESDQNEFPGYRLTDRKVTYKISPNSFYQVNPTQTEKLYSLAVEYANLHGQEIVWDMYCGIGTISLFLAQRAKKVYGVEIVPQAIEDAKINAENNHFDNTEFFVGRAEEVLPEWFEKTKEHVDVIVVDPPRKGCDEKSLETMLRMQPERIVYVSCDPATLARDLKILCESQYRIEKVRPVDMFAHTVHVETVVLLRHINSGGKL